MILSAVIGGRAGKPFLRPDRPEFVTTASVIGEVKEYIPVLCRKKRLNSDLAFAILRRLPVREVPEDEYSAFLPKAAELIGHRDPDDVHLTALALSLGCPVWSNDSDFKDIEGIAVYDTRDFLAATGMP